MSDSTHGESDGRAASRRERSCKRVLLGRIFLALSCSLLLGGCGGRQGDGGPTIDFNKIPHADKGDTQDLDEIGGRVNGAVPGQRIILYARSGPWYVQPYVDQPFTSIQTDLTWSNATHPGTEYAALLVEPGYQPPSVTDVLPTRGGAVVAVAVTKGRPAFWQTWWFRVLVGLAFAFALLSLYRLRLRQLTRQMNVRFEERLAERVRIAQELHDTLLQGFLSASMQLHVVVDNLPADSPARAPLGHIQRLVGQVIEEGRDAVRGLRSDSGQSLDLEQAFSRIRQELSVEGPGRFRVVVEGRPRHLHPLIRDEVYRIGHEALVNAFRHSNANSIEVEVEYLDRRLRLLVSDDGDGIDAAVLRSGREGHWGLSGMRERAEKIGAELKVRSRAAAGTEVELSVPGHVAFKTDSSSRSRGWLAGLYRRATGEHARESSGSEVDK